MFTNPLMILVRIFLFLTLIGSGFAEASIFLNGTYKIIQGQHFLVKYNLEKVPLKISSYEIHNQFLMLDINDYIFVTATETSTGINVDSINFVGLQRLLGSWLGRTYIWHFKSYSELILIPRKSFRSGDEIRLSYSITPNEDRTWTLLISSPQFIKIATIHIYRSIITLDFDEISDLINQDSILSRMNEQKLF